MQDVIGDSYDALLRYWAQARPDTPALIEGARVTSFADADRLTRQVANGLRAAGLDRGDRIAWLGKNSDLYFILQWGAARTGIATAPVGWRLAPDEVRYILEDTRAAIVFVAPEFLDVIEELRPRLTHLKHVILTSEAWAWIAAQPEDDFAPPAPMDEVLQLYTSGTTGRPKGVVLTNRNLFELRKYTTPANLGWDQWEEGEVGLIIMPVAHIAGSGYGAITLYSGVTGLVCPEFSPDIMLDAIEQYTITRFFLVPAALHMVVNHPRAATTDFSRVKYVLYGAAPIPLALLKQCMEVFGAQFVQNYGMTETTGTIVALPPEDHDPAGTVRMRAAGKALPGVELKVIDGNGAAVGPNVVGEICCRTPQIMKEYWGNPAATAATVNAEGWLRTGDAGYLDEDGYLFIHDRVKDMIVSGAENIYPAEVENAIFGHPAVAEVAVIGVPDEKWGEAVKAMVVAKPGMVIDPADIIAWARKSIAGYKLPKSVDVIAVMPRNPSGKILRRELRAPFGRVASGK